MDLGTIQKNAREEIRLTAETFKGHVIINIRVWYQDDAGEMRPGKQGLAFRVDLLPTVLETLSRARKGGAA
ncbi:transcriptional coactivator p15/PC4 family protein [Paracoccus everestensis]|uniref:transcriptional coactivator p15/PC4 family protein n=1 Tax=Paracoccus everestensis TaxID=2903900 RepID=UPI001F15CBBB|nr:transcriptional coactivator p15/PC4 family protein [Paracoccus everestensis]